MKPIHFISALFGILAGLLDLVVLTGFRSGYAVPLMLFVGLALGQLALLAFWCVLGGGVRLTRLLTTLAAAAGLSHPLGKVTGCTWPQWFTLFCLFAACAAGTIVLARFLGFRASIVAPDARATSRGEEQPPSRGRFQYSLGGLLTAMTSAGILMGLSRHFVFPTEQGLDVAIYGFWLVLTATTAFWALASRQALPVRLIGLAAMCLAAGWFMVRTESQSGVWFFTNIAFIEAIMICAGITILQGDWCADQPTVAQVSSVEGLQSE